LKAAYGLPSPEFGKNRMYEQDSKIAIGKTMSGDPPTMASVTSQSLAWD
jgi:hypothetical protein